MVFPVYQQIKASIHYFFVPNRVAFKPWEQFITGGRLGTSTPAPSVYPISDFFEGATGWHNFFVDGQLADYLGYPTSADAKFWDTHSMPDFDFIPFFDYQLIYDTFYRDETLEQPLFSVDGGYADSQTGCEDLSQLHDASLATPAVASVLFPMRTKCWKKDYFTTATPSPQRGASVLMPSGGSSVADQYSTLFLETDGTLSPRPAGRSPLQTLAPRASFGAPTMNDFYKGSALQRWLQRNSKGYRYIEQMANHFGVHVPDYRLQRPQYLGGISQNVQISEITQTSETTANSALGQYAGRAVASGVGKRITFEVPEHGYIMGIMSIYPLASYCQGVRRNLIRSDKFDYFWRDFEGIGQQPIYNKELSCFGNLDGVFGYQERYAEYKFHGNEVHGDFRNTMSDWTMSRIFSSAPALNQDFLHVDNQVSGNNRIFAVPSASSHLLCTVNNIVTAYRQVSPYEQFHTL